MVLLKDKKKQEILAENLSTMDYGTVINHEQIAQLIDEAYPSTKYNSTVTAAKKILLRDYGKVIENIKKTGYRIVQPDNYTDASMSHFRRGFKAMQKGTDTLAGAPINDMTEEGRETYRRVYDRVVTLQASMNGVKAELKTLTKKEHPFLAAMKR
jgi:hypothetical protein